MSDSARRHPARMQLGHFIPVIEAQEFVPCPRLLWDLHGERFVQVREHLLDQFVSNRCGERNRGDQSADSLSYVERAARQGGGPKIGVFGDPDRDPFRPGLSQFAALFVAFWILVLGGMAALFGAAGAHGLQLQPPPAVFGDSLGSAPADPGTAYACVTAPAGLMYRVNECDSHAATIDGHFIPYQHHGQTICYEVLLAGHGSFGYQTLLFTCSWQGVPEGA